MSHDDAGAASGITYVASQVGSALGLAILVTVFAITGATTLTGKELLTHRIVASLTAGAVLLVISLFIVIAWMVRHQP